MQSLCLPVCHRTVMPTGPPETDPCSWTCSSDRTKRRALERAQQYYGPAFQLPKKEETRSWQPKSQWDNGGDSHPQDEESTSKHIKHLLLGSPSVPNNVTKHLTQNIYLSRGPTRTMWTYPRPVFHESSSNFWTVDLHNTHGQHP